MLNADYSTERVCLRAREVENRSRMTGEPTVKSMYNIDFGKNERYKRVITHSLLYVLIELLIPKPSHLRHLITSQANDSLHMW